MRSSFDGQALRREIVWEEEYREQRQKQLLVPDARVREENHLMQSFCRRKTNWTRALTFLGHLGTMACCVPAMQRRTDRLLHRERWRARSALAVRGPSLRNHLGVPDLGCFCKGERRMPHKRAWTDADIARLKHLAGKMPATQIAAELTRTYTALIVEASKLGISLRHLRRDGSVKTTAENASLTQAD
jgi:hypothetical protein